jgi:hypothetical protein
MAITVSEAAEMPISGLTVQASANNRDVFAATCAGVMAAITLTTAPASMADIRLPPLDKGESNASIMLALAMVQPWAACADTKPTAGCMQWYKLLAPYLDL